MNKSVLTTLLLCLSLTLFAQSVQRVEYFFDTDPGLGKGQALSIDAEGKISTAIDISSLEEGLHMLAIRARSSAGKWSVAKLVPVSVLHSSEVQAVEYYFDEDPGFGKGTALAFTKQGDAHVVNATIDVSALQAGLHTLSIRFQNSAGEWSIASHTLVSILPDDEVKAIEYYFDEDPGFGKGTALAFTNQEGYCVVNTTVDISTLRAGLHTLSIRFLNSAGKWSLASHTLVSVLQDTNVQAIEYFFDEDPGFGKGTALEFTQQGNAFVVNTTLDVSALAEGVHYLSIRAQNSGGVWGKAIPNLLLKRTPAHESDSIVAVKYYWDENSAAKNDLAFTQTGLGADVSAVINGLDTFEIDTKHYLFVEYHTAKGNVSQSCFEVTRIESPVGTGTEQVTITELKIYPVPFTTQLFIDALGEGDRVVLTDLSGRQLLAATKAEIVGGLQVGHLPAGTYLLTVYQEQNVISKVVIKQ